VIVCLIEALDTVGAFNMVWDWTLAQTGGQGLRLTGRWNGPVSHS